MKQKKTHTIIGIYCMLTRWPLEDLNEILRKVIFKLNLTIGGGGISCEITLGGLSLDFTNDN